MLESGVSLSFIFHDTKKNKDSLLTFETNSGSVHSAATQSALHFHVIQILIENPRQHLTTQPVGNIQHRFLSRHIAPTRHIVPFSVLGCLGYPNFAKENCMPS